MANIVSVAFKDGGKAYYFDPGDLEVTAGQTVVVETTRGVECGRATTGRQVIPDEQVPRALKRVVRIATDDDIKRIEENRRKEVEAFGIATQKITARGLQMKLVRAEYAFDGSKILFCFTADGRVDFRELVRDLAGVFRTRIELRQIGIRDEAKIFGGLGICGRPFCCATFIGDFQPVSIKMAKTQGLSLNPVKISGTCGRLMCCLKYEQKAYEDLIKNTPRIGTTVKTPEGTGTIVDVALLTGKVSVRLDSAPEGLPHAFHKRQITAMDGSKYGTNEPDTLGALDENMIEELEALEDHPESNEPENKTENKPRQDHPRRPKINHNRDGNHYRGGQRNHSQGENKPNSSQANTPNKTVNQQLPKAPKTDEKTDGQIKSGGQPGKRPGGQNRNRSRGGNRSKPNG